jgi:hypothetical protein
MSILRAYFDGSYNVQEDLGGIGMVVFRDHQLEQVYRKTIVEVPVPKLIDIYAFEYLSEELSKLDADHYEICGDTLDGLRCVDKILTGQQGPRYEGSFYGLIRKIVKNLFPIRNRLSLIFIGREQNGLADFIARQASGADPHETYPVLWEHVLRYSSNMKLPNVYRKV